MCLRFPGYLHTHVFVFRYLQTHQHIHTHRWFIVHYIYFCPCGLTTLYRCSLTNGISNTIPSIKPIHRGCWKLERGWCPNQSIKYRSRDQVPKGISGTLIFYKGMVLMEHKLTISSNICKKCISELTWLIIKKSIFKFSFCLTRASYSIHLHAPLLQIAPNKCVGDIDEEDIFKVVPKHSQEHFTLKRDKKKSAVFDVSIQCNFQLLEVYCAKLLIEKTHYFHLESCWQDFSPGGVN